MKRYLYYTLAILALWGCTEDEDLGGVSSSAEIITLQAKDVFYDNAVLQGEYTPASAKASALGFVFSEDPLTDTNPGTEYLADGVTPGIFSLRVKDLERKSDYYVKAFVEHTSGERVFGREIRFMTDSIMIVAPGKPTGTVTAIAGRTVSVESKASTIGDEALTNTEKKLAAVKLADCGIYYWLEDDVEENAQFYSIGEAVASSYADPKAKITYTLENLEPNTTYNYRIAIRTLVNFNSGKWFSYGEEVKSDQATFQTAELELPAATTLEAMEITPTSFTAHGMLDDNGKDPLVKYGIVYGTSADNLGNSLYADNLSAGVVKLFSLFIQNLTPSTTYYFSSFAENDAGRAVSSIVKSFTTAAPGVPVLGDYPYEYDFRVKHFSTSSLRLRAKMISDGGDVVTSKGFYWGLTPDAVTNKLEVTAEAALEGMYNAFSAELTSVEGGVVYYKPFAVNSKGEAVTDAVYAARTAINGGKLYCFDASKRLTPTYNNMILSNTDLLYYELDPVTSSTAVYYILDRNIGATMPYGESFYNKSFAQSAEYPELFEAAGYYYQFDRPIPSSTPDMKVTGQITASPHNWTNTASYFTDPEMNETGPTWEQKVCPPGYDLPTQEEMTDILATLQPIEADQTMPKLFKAMRFGATGGRTYANGNLLNNTDPTACEIWLKGPHPTGNKEGIIMRIKTPPTGTVAFGNANRYSARPVRCIRKEEITTEEDI